MGHTQCMAGAIPLGCPVAAPHREHGSHAVYGRGNPSGLPGGLGRWVSIIKICKTRCNFLSVSQFVSFTNSITTLLPIRNNMSVVEDREAQLAQVCRIGNCVDGGNLATFDREVEDAEQPPV